MFPSGISERRGPPHGWCAPLLRVQVPYSSQRKAPESRKVLGGFVFFRVGADNGVERSDRSPGRRGRRCGRRRGGPVVRSGHQDRASHHPGHGARSALAVQPLLSSFANFGMDVDADGRVDEVVFGFPLATAARRGPNSRSGGLRRKRSRESPGSRRNRRQRRSSATRPRSSTPRLRRTRRSHGRRARSRCPPASVRWAATGWALAISTTTGAPTSSPRAASGRSLWTPTLAGRPPQSTSLRTAPRCTSSTSTATGCPTWCRAARAPPGPHRRRKA